MRLLLTLALAAAAGAGATRGASAHTVSEARADTIFRYVSIGRGIPIRLGEPIPESARPLLREAGPGNYDVAPGAFGGARTISIRTTGDGRVRAFVFGYDADEGFEERVARYAGSLGVQVTSARNGIRTARWEDGATRFEVVERSGTIGAMLTDLRAAAAHEHHGDGRR